MRSALLIVLSLTLLLSPYSFSQDALTDAEIKKWAGAYEAVVEWAEKTDFKNPPNLDRDNMDMSRVYTQMLETSQGEPFYKDLVSVLKKHGYSDAQQWGQLGDRILMAFVANEMDASKIDIQQQLAEAQKMMKDLPPEQQAMMQSMLKQSTEAMKSADQAPEADKAAVNRNRVLLEKSFNMK